MYSKEVYSCLTQYVLKRNLGLLRNVKIRGCIENAIRSNICMYPSTQPSKVLSFGKVIHLCHGQPIKFGSTITPNSRYRPPMRRFTASTPGRETQRFHMHLLMFLLLQRLQLLQARAASGRSSSVDGCGEAVEAAEAAEAVKT